MSNTLIPFEKYEAEVEKQNSPLKVEAAQLLDKAMAIKVTDEATLKAANDLKGDINAHTKRVKDLRLQLTRPIDDFKSLILGAEKAILVDLDEAKTAVASEMLAYEERLEAARQAEAERVSAIVLSVTVVAAMSITLEDVQTAATKLDADWSAISPDDQELAEVKLAYSQSRNALEAREDALVEEAKAQAERLRLAKEAAEQSAERQKIEAEKARIEADRLRLENERKQLERQKQEQELEAQRLAAQKEAEKAAAAKTKINAVTLKDFTIDDASLVPVQYLSPDEKKIRQAIKDGVTDIPGITITERKVVR